MRSRHDAGGGYERGLVEQRDAALGPGARRTRRRRELRRIPDNRVLLPVTRLCCALVSRGSCAAVLVLDGLTDEVMTALEAWAGDPRRASGDCA